MSFFANFANAFLPALVSNLPKIIDVGAQELTKVVSGKEDPMSGLKNVGLALGKIALTEAEKAVGIKDPRKFNETVMEGLIQVPDLHRQIKKVNPSIGTINRQNMNDRRINPVRPSMVDNAGSGNLNPASLGSQSSPVDILRDTRGGESSQPKRRRARRRRN